MCERLGWTMEQVMESPAIYIEQMAAILPGLDAARAKKRAIAARLAAMDGNKRRR